MIDEGNHARPVGAAVLLALGIAVFAILGAQGRHLVPGIHVRVTVARAGALRAGARVQVAGLVIGRVESVSLVPAPGEPQNTRVAFDLWIARKHAWLVHENSEIFVNTQSFLGEPYLEVGAPRGAPPGPVVTDGAVVRGVDPIDLDRILERGYEELALLDQAVDLVKPQAHELGKEIDVLDGVVTGLDPAPTIADTRRLVGEGKGLAAVDVQPSVAAGRRLSAHGDRFLANARESVARLRARIDQVKQVAARLDDRFDPARRARIDALLADLNVLIGRLDLLLAGADAVVALVTDENGSIGAFLADPQLADDVKDLTRQLKHEPWRVVGHPGTR